jgi:hypothetical protein
VVASTGVPRQAPNESTRSVPAVPPPAQMPENQAPCEGGVPSRWRARSSEGPPLLTGGTETLGGRQRAVARRGWTRSWRSAPRSPLRSRPAHQDGGPAIQCHHAARRGRAGRVVDRASTAGFKVWVTASVPGSLDEAPATNPFTGPVCDLGCHRPPSPVPRSPDGGGSPVRGQGVEQMRLPLPPRS